MPLGLTNIVVIDATGVSQVPRLVEDENMGSRQNSKTSRRLLRLSIVEVGKLKV